MKKLRSHFWYTKNQRSGILLLLGLIICVQGIILFYDFEGDSEPIAFSQDLLNIQTEIDSLKSNKSTYKLNPFNPNFISDFKGYQLGMSVEEIDRLLEFRKKGHYVNSASEFQVITKVSDSLLKTLSPKFKFPEWVTKQNSTVRKNQYVKIHVEEPKTSDLNQATVNDFQFIVDKRMAHRIVNYRNKLGGYYFKDQLLEVWGMSAEDYAKLSNLFTIQSKPVIHKLNINTASFKEVLSLPYIDYQLCKKIFNYRDEVAELQSISELKNIDGFPIKKYERIVLYLLAK